ncbi:Zn(II)2Cys6 transcription factor [Drepanopeziza brunnea f. sp. 'multigermtubi' MB_m1]|uniref:Zn(II)2Cys6 transcription factor n=1 Tax=Marssonina brunnea f. sp. multigermtubi (strain MB_m1) TaxID=1072389 RepID=K1X702_MARBU|nr:Zn(II)2Cys6 transcription factor [Drepanopeziza brunnea f. sp. 'multigermtubi' MB_m1]EKD20866.1 Zn(II)2Cys6 transcription factor [Drepanopeziza brunnea f. sp. 'multigermtubi' MB_m1]
MSNLYPRRRDGNEVAKLKCDETKPICGQCKKGNRECHPSDGVVFRHQQNASMNGAGKKEEGKLGGFYAYKNSFKENHTWVDVPRTVTFCNIADPYNTEPSPEPDFQEISAPVVPPRGDEKPQGSYLNIPYEQAPGLEALSAAATSTFQYIRPSPADSHASPYQSNNLNFILNPTGPESSLSFSSSAIDPALMDPPQILVLDDPPPVDDHEVAFLLRHFGETAGQWMDLFDLGCYFAHHVPIQALSNPLLRYSACAYAAKQLGRVHGKKAAVGGNAGRLADMEQYPRPQQSANWPYVGAKYYDRAILLLMEELSNSRSHGAPVAPLTGGEDAFTPSSDPSSLGDQRMPGNKRRRLSRSAHFSHADETLAAAAILCVYEFLDNANTAWSRHLSGTKSLFDLAEKEGMMPVQSPTSPGQLSERISPSRARRATFWNFARQDFLAAFINKTQTRLNTHDISMWKAAGIQLDEQGFVIASNTEDSQFPDRQAVMREDMISNALIWLMSKIINFLASGDSVDHVYPQESGSPSGILGINQMLLLERWKELEKELEIWYRGLPETFKPCARLPPVVDGSLSPNSARAIFSEIWYSVPMCASAMQSYHMARAILLVNKPNESTARRSTLSSRIGCCRNNEKEIRYHAHEICGIALARPDGSVRINQVQAMFVAGQCLTETRERQVVLEILRDIETDLGWATDYRVQKLLSEWGWNQEPS